MRPLEAYRRRCEECARELGSETALVLRLLGEFAAAVEDELRLRERDTDPPPPLRVCGNCAQLHPVSTGGYCGLDGSAVGRGHTCEWWGPHV